MVDATNKRKWHGNQWARVEEKERWIKDAPSVQKAVRELSYASATMNDLARRVRSKSVRNALTNAAFILNDLGAGITNAAKEP